MPLYPILGLMSGTSIDGIDASLVLTDGINLRRTGSNSITPYKDNTRRLLLKALENPENFIKNTILFKKLTYLITLEHSEVALKYINTIKKKPKLIGFHGQTIFHKPSIKQSVQIGNGKMLANICKTNVVFNFRKDDLISNGQGAPIAPIYHKLILEKKKYKLPSAIINIGGISNITFWDGQELIGFDIGPGNNLMDNFMQIKYGLLYDENGLLAKSGKPNKKLINSFLNLPFFHKPPPKSLERYELINNEVYNQILSLKPEDCMATLAKIIVESIKVSFQLLPKVPLNIIIVGGGQYNENLMEIIKSNLSERVFTAKELSLPGNFLEAELIAFLAARKVKNLPSTFPSITGVDKSTVLGSLVKYQKRLYHRTS